MHTFNHTEVLETAHKLAEGSKNVCAAIDTFLCLPDEIPLTVGDARATFEAIKVIMNAQQSLINKHTEHALSLDDMLTSVVEKHTKK